MNMDIKSYNEGLSESDKDICDLIAATIDNYLIGSESKIWHSHPVWFIDGNPITGYSKQKAGVRLMFWSGADFKEEKLNIIGKKFKDASIIYTSINQVIIDDLKRWIELSSNIQWDYKNIVKRKGILERLK